MGVSKQEYMGVAKHVYKDISSHDVESLCEILTGL